MYKLSNWNGHHFGSTGFSKGGHKVKAIKLIFLILFTSTSWLFYSVDDNQLN